MANHSKSNYHESLKLYGKALKIRKESKNIEKEIEKENILKIGEIHKNIGFILKNKNKNEQALKNFYISLKIFKTDNLEHHSLLTEVYTGISLALENQGEYEEALKI